MINITNKHNCCGCAACAQRCPRQCISMHQDKEGFLYPQIDTSNCIDCGLCEKVCPFIHPYDARTPRHTYAAINNDEKIRMESSSGGIFTLLAEDIINQGGIVFGACYDANWQVKLDYTETIEGLAAFRGSKYVQARTENTFNQCETFLKSGRKVMYSGTPCQIAGLKHYLRKEYENLLTVDFVCHGVPSPKVWAKYLQEVVGTVNVYGISMRDKQREGWKRYNFVIEHKKDGKTISLASCYQNNDYMKAFLRDMILRPSCYACKAKECRSHSDITIADFWGIQTIFPEMDDDKGTSILIVNSMIGEGALDLSQVIYKESIYDCVKALNPACYQSAKEPLNRNKFFELVERKSVITAIKESVCVESDFIGLIKKIIHRVRRVIK